jgi:hypothetical protein
MTLLAIDDEDEENLKSSQATIPTTIWRDEGDVMMFRVWMPKTDTIRLVNGYSIPNFGYRLGWGRTDRGLGLGLICQTSTQPVPQPRFFTL